ncbi:MAG TPA: DUF4347 domain-containing protein [Burkholderiaceae bacterium]|nr:DUF4347 domain-containing protein [Burkholderiaceae bacterium]
MQVSFHNKSTRRQLLAVEQRLLFDGAAAAAVVEPLSALAHATQADVTASTDRTGASHLGGDRSREAAAGLIAPIGDKRERSSSTLSGDGPQIADGSVSGSASAAGDEVLELGPAIESAVAVAAAPPVSSRPAPLPIAATPAAGAPDGAALRGDADRNQPERLRTAGHDNFARGTTPASSDPQRISASS